MARGRMKGTAHSLNDPIVEAFDMRILNGLYGDIERCSRKQRKKTRKNTLKHFMLARPAGARGEGVVVSLPIQHAA